MNSAMPSRLFGSVILVCSILLLPPLAALADPITVPSDLSPGDQYRLAFVTSTSTDATSTDITTYNDFVTAVADAVSQLNALGTTWAAIASTDSETARDNTGTNPGVSTGVPIYLLDGTRLANDNAGLWSGSILTPLRIQEDGTTAASGGVWTGSDQSGIGANGPPSEALGTAFPVLGLDNASDSNWMIISDQPSTNTAPPICDFGRPHRGA